MQIMQHGCTQSVRVPASRSQKPRAAKLSPHCVETIFDSHLPSPKLSPKTSSRTVSPPQERFFSSFCEIIERQKLPHGNILHRDIKMSLLAHGEGRGLRGESTVAFPNAGPIVPEPFSLLTFSLISEDFWVFLSSFLIC